MELTKSTRLCTTCRHCHAHPELITFGSRITQYQCFHPNNILSYSLVDGSPTFKDPYCDHHRKQGAVMVSFCRVEGAWWEAATSVNLTQTKVSKSNTDLLSALGGSL